MMTGWILFALFAGLFVGTFIGLLLGIYASALNITRLMEEGILPKPKERER
ncbi:MAG: hypothetical protein WC910_10620 [Bacteroidales bacterium]|jgi:predicted PurR-regulated permease PerM